MAISQLIHDSRMKFLEFFEPKLRSGVANNFLEVIRKGETDPGKVLTKLLNNSWRSHLHGTIRQYYTQARQYVEYLLQWESLSFEEKDQIKRARSQEYIDQHMEKLPATVKQVNYLRSLGYAGTVPENRRKAKELIDKFLKQKGWIR